MRQGFEGFLAQYCRTLTRLDSRSLKRLFARTVEDSPRAAEPLLLLALCQGRAAYLLKLATGTKHRDAYESFVSGLTSSGLGLEAYLASGSAPERYRKTYDSYLSQSGKLSRDRDVVGQLVPLLNSLIAQRGTSRYRLAEDLGLNKGNLYAFLKGNTDKLSREKAIAVYRHLLDGNGT